METLDDLAEAASATDLFALRMVDDGQLANLGGSGRGRGWAGNVTVDPRDDELLAAALRTGEVTRHRGDVRAILGPYWAESAAAVSVGDYLIVFGGDGVADDDELIFDLAGQAAWMVGAVPAEKLLADELELTQASMRVLSVDRSSTDASAQGLADVAAECLSCEWAAVVLRDPLRLFTCERGWTPTASGDQVISALLPLMDEVRDGIVVEQDMSRARAANRPLSFDDGLIARCIAPLGVGASRGLLVAAHTVSSPRGFTSLCQRVADTMASHGGLVLSPVA